jgi:hypothetical protein
MQLHPWCFCFSMLPGKTIHASFLETRSWLRRSPTCLSCHRSPEPFGLRSVANISHLSYGSMIDVNQFTVISEIFPSHIRGEAACISIGSLLLVDVLWLELQPVASRTIGWKYYLVFAAMGIAHTVYLYFFLPEVSRQCCLEFARRPPFPQHLISRSFRCHWRNKDAHDRNVLDLWCGTRGAGPNLCRTEHRRSKARRRRRS